jgi:hypothetical protein
VPRPNKKRKKAKPKPKVVLSDDDDDDEEVEVEVDDDTSDMHMDGVPRQKPKESKQERLFREKQEQTAERKQRLWNAKKAKLPPIVAPCNIDENTPKGHYKLVKRGLGWQVGNVVNLEMPVIKDGFGYFLYSALDTSICHVSGKSASYRHHQRVWLVEGTVPANFRSDGVWMVKFIGVRCEDGVPVGMPYIFVTPWEKITKARNKVLIKCLMLRPSDISSAETYLCPFVLEQNHTARMTRVYFTEFLQNLCAEEKAARLEKEAAQDVDLDKDPPTDVTCCAMERCVFRGTEPSGNHTCQKCGGSYHAMCGNEGDDGDIYKGVCFKCAPSPIPDPADDLKKAQALTEEAPVPTPQPRRSTRPPKPSAKILKEGNKDITPPQFKNSSIAEAIGLAETLSKASEDSLVFVIT